MNFFGVLQTSGGGSIKSKFFEQGLNNLSLEDKSTGQETSIGIKLPPPPPGPVSPGPISPVVAPEKSPSAPVSKFSLEESSPVKESESEKGQAKLSVSAEKKITQDIPDDDFGDFQAAK